MERNNTTALGVMTVVLTLLGWSSVPLFLRHFAQTIDPWTSNGWRYGFSALVWLPVLVVTMYRSRLPKGLWAAAFIPSVVNAAGQVCFTWAHYRIDPGLLTFGLRSQLVFVAIGAWLLFPAERAIIRSPGYLLGAAILIAGMAGVIVLDETAGAEVEKAVQTTGAQWGTKLAHIQGVALAIASGLLFACYGLAVRKYMHGVNSVLAFAAICQYTALAMVGLMFVFGTRWGADVLDMGPDQFALLLVSALLGIAIGHVFYYISIARLGVAVTAGVLQLQPFFVAMGSLTWFDEQLSLGQWLSGIIAVAGAMLMLSVQWRISQKKHVSQRPLEIAEGESGS